MSHGVQSMKSVGVSQSFIVEGLPRTHSSSSVSALEDLGTDLLMSSVSPSLSVPGSLKVRTQFFHKTQARSASLAKGEPCRPRDRRSPPKRALTAPRDLGRLRNDRELLEHLVGDSFAHRDPFAALRKNMFSSACKLAPAMRFEDSTIRRRRTIECPTASSRPYVPPPIRCSSLPRDDEDRVTDFESRNVCDRPDFWSPFSIAGNVTSCA